MIDHGKRITHESWYEGELVSSVIEQEISLLSSKDTLLKDIIDALIPITKEETHKLTVEICIDKKGRWRLVKRWVTE